MRSGRIAGESGAAVVEFALISVLLVFVLFGVLQVAVYVYVRNIVMGDAASSARFAAAAGIDSSTAGARASQLISDTVGASVAAGLPCTSADSIDPATGLNLVVVHCAGQVRSSFLPVGAFLSLDLTATALKEPAR